MYARVTTGELQHGKIDDAVKIWNEVLPPYKQVKGFHGGYLLADLTTNNTVMITLWESKEASCAHIESGEMMQALSQFFSLMSELPDMEGYEVAATV